MHADGKSTLASVSKWNSGKVNRGGEDNNLCVEESNGEDNNLCEGTR